MLASLVKISVILHQQNFDSGFPEICFTFRNLVTHHHILILVVYAIATYKTFKSPRIGNIWFLHV